MHGDIEVRYRATDERRMEIPWVKIVNRATGREEVFLRNGTSEADVADLPERVMDCVDCHNQPSHRFEEKTVALDRAMAGGRISPKLPFIRKQAMEVLDGRWERTAAREKIREALVSFYEKEEPLGDELRPLLEPAAEEIATIYLRNVYPRMNIDFDTYRRLLRHEGCRRCHEGEHESKLGNIIPVDCSLCHVLLSNNDPNAPILHQLGIRRK
jgi:hypothetical protein